MIVTPCESNINTVTEEHFSSESRHRGIAVNDEVPSTSSETIKQIEVVKDVVLPEVSNLNESVITKRQEDETQFSPEK